MFCDVATVGMLYGLFTVGTGATRGKYPSCVRGTYREKRSHESAVTCEGTEGLNNIFCIIMTLFSTQVLEDNCTYSICNTNGEYDRQNLHIDSTGLYMLPGLWDLYIARISFVYHLYMPGTWEWVCRWLGRMIGPALERARHQAAQTWEFPRHQTAPPPSLASPCNYPINLPTGRMIDRGKPFPLARPQPRYLSWVPIGFLLARTAHVGVGVYSIRSLLQVCPSTQKIQLIYIYMCVSR